MPCYDSRSTYQAGREESQKEIEWLEAVVCMLSRQINDGKLLGAENLVKESAFEKSGVTIGAYREWLEAHAIKDNLRIGK